jgi:two-component system, OmpR family, phosphate regulon sensor histidine kinase PhoR
MSQPARSTSDPPTATAFGVRIFFFTLAVFGLGLGFTLNVLHRDASGGADVHLQDQLLMRARLAADRVSAERPASAAVDWDSLLARLAGFAGAELRLRSLDGSWAGSSGPKSAGESMSPEATEALRSGVGVGRRSHQDGNPESIVVAVPWTSGGAVVGTLELEAEVDPRPDRSLQRSALWGAGAALAGALLVAYLAVALFGRRAQALARVATGESESVATRTPSSQDDPFVRLNDAVRSLADRVGAGALELATEKARLGRVLSSMNEGVLLVDVDGRVRLVNSALNAMLTVADEPLGKAVDDVLESPKLVSLIHEAPEGEHQAVEVSSRQSPARKILASVRRLPQGAGVLAVCVDVTEQRRLETVRQEFVSNASHELRTPIAAILSAVETLQNIGAVQGAAETGFMEMIGRNALRLKALVDDLLALSHIESGAIQVPPEPVKLRMTVEAIMNDLAPQARARSTQLVCNVSDDLVVMASLRGLQHVISNLIDNAIKYCPPDSRVTVQAQREDGKAVISVVDNGPGIPEVHRDRIFERFYRIDAGRSRGLGGTGLGLSIVKHWVEAMGGTIAVAAAPGGGTAFRVELIVNPAR